MTTLHDAEVAARFDALSHRFKASVESTDYRMKALSQALEGLERPIILDLGCGKGRFARLLIRGGASVIGVDLSMSMLCEAFGLTRVRSTARRLPFPNGTFDALIAVETMEHVDIIADVLDEALRVLRPGGRLIILDKNRSALDSNRPWIPAIMIKRIDERRGLWMYPAGGPVRERWFGSGLMSSWLASRFDSVSVDHPISPAESRWWIFRAFPSIRRMICWTATAPGGTS